MTPLSHSVCCSPALSKSQLNCCATTIRLITKNTTISLLQHSSDADSMCYKSGCSGTAVTLQFLCSTPVTRLYLETLTLYCLKYTQATATHQVTAVSLHNYTCDQVIPGELGTLTLYYQMQTQATATHQGGVPGSLDPRC